MADPVEICACPEKWIDDRSFRIAVLSILCNLTVGAGGTASPDLEFQILCDPVTGQRVCLKKTLSIDGVTIVEEATIAGTTTAYTGDVQTLINCERQYDGELQSICDNGVPKIMCLVKVDGVLDPTLTAYLDSAGQPTAPPVNPALVTLGECGSSSAVECKEICLCDDVAGDGSVIVPFKRYVSLDLITGVTTQIGDYVPDLSATYTVLGTAVNCCSIGSPSSYTQESIILNGAGSFTVTSDVVSYSVKVISKVGATNGSITASTFKGTTTPTRPLLVGETVNFDTAPNAVSLSPGAVVVAGPDEIIAIDYEEYTT